MQLDNPLWRYALKVYSTPSVEQACLDAQQKGLHVNTLLFCCWLASRGEHYGPQYFSNILTLWRDPVLHPLRQVRYHVRELLQQHPQLKFCYQHLKQSELAAEQVDMALLWQLHQLHTLSVPVDSSLAVSSKALAQSNIASYLKAANIEAVVVAACCNELVDALPLTDSQLQV